MQCKPSQPPTSFSAPSCTRARVFEQPPQSTSGIQRKPRIEQTKHDENKVPGLEHLYKRFKVSTRSQCLVVFIESVRV